MYTQIIAKLFIYGAAILPAVIMITIRRMISPINYNFFQDIYRFVGYGMFNFICFGIIAKVFDWHLIDIFYPSKIYNNPFPFIIFVFLSPLVLGLILSAIDKYKLMNKFFKAIFDKNIETFALTTWEEFFAENPVGDINVVLKDGTQIIGRFTEPSKVSSSIEHKDIFINEVTAIGFHKFNKPISIWIAGSDISYILIDKDGSPSTRLLVAQNSQVISNLSDEISELRQEITNLKNNNYQKKENKDD